MGRSVYQLDDEVRSKARIDFAFAGWQFDVRQAILSMPELSGDEFLKQWMLRPRRNWNVTTIRERNHPQRILEPLYRRHIAGNDRDGAHVQLWRVKREHQRHCVVGSGVGIENDFLRSSGSRLCEREADQDHSRRPCDIKAEVF